MRIPAHREPTHPGEMLLKEFLEPMGISQRDLATAIGVPYQRVNELTNGRRGVTPATALRLARFLGTTAELWLTLQMRWELSRAMRDEAGAVGRIKRFRKSGRAA